MRGEFSVVWSETWREIGLPLTDRDGGPEDIFCELAPGAGRANCNFARSRCREVAIGKWPE